MPIRFEEDRAVLEEVCTVEEAEPLLDWLRGADDARSVDLSACSHAHTAVIQVLLAAKPRVAAPPKDAVLARVLGLAGAGSQPP